MLCGTKKNNGNIPKYSPHSSLRWDISKIFLGIPLVPQHIVMDVNNVMMNVSCGNNHSC